MQCKKLLFLISCLSFFPSFTHNQNIPVEVNEIDPLNDILNESIELENVTFNKPHPIVIFFQEKSIFVLLKFFAFKEYCSRLIKKIYRPFSVHPYDTSRR